MARGAVVTFSAHSTQMLGSIPASQTSFLFVELKTTKLLDFQIKIKYVVEKARFELIKI